ncbi:MAG: sulfur carrier protein ThiS [Deltaproteobacteria bacterium]|nr:sulfur carrier protein ThiS [Deltaproteobacteria bacterium]
MVTPPISGTTVPSVEGNLDIVPKAAHETHVLSAGDRIEIVHFVGGG